jgi:hypothetical protein
MPQPRLTFLCIYILLSGNLFELSTVSQDEELRALAARLINVEEREKGKNLSLDGRNAELNARLKPCANLERSSSSNSYQFLGSTG